MRLGPSLAPGSAQGAQDAYGLHSSGIYTASPQAMPVARLRERPERPPGRRRGLNPTLRATRAASSRSANRQHRPAHARLFRISGP